MQNTSNSSGIKIKVGSHFKPNQQKVDEKKSLVDINLSSAQASDSLLDPLASTTSLFDLCDKNFSRNNGKRKCHLSDYGKSSNVKSKAIKSVSNAHLTDQSLKKDVGPQVEIVNGQIVLKESSLLIGGLEPTVAEGDYEEVEEEVNAMSKYSSYMDKRKSAPWGIEETRLFYHALRQCGTEFSLMQTFFPSRTRKELKHKFIREENSHPELVKRSLDSGVPLDLLPFEIMMGEKLTNAVEPV